MNSITSNRLQALHFGIAILLVASCGEDSSNQRQYTLANPTLSAPQCYAEPLPGLAGTLHAP